jgi:predicted acetyltransferase
VSLLRPVGEDETSAFWSMLADYLVEHAAMADPDGRFDPLDMPTFGLYWLEAHRRPSWIVDTSGAPAGLALVNDHYAPSGQAVDHGLVEFYVVPAHRRTGLGLAAARELFGSLPGWWELQVSLLNPAGLAFWPRAIESVGPRLWERVPTADTLIHRFRVTT